MVERISLELQQIPPNTAKDGEESVERGLEATGGCSKKKPDDLLYYLRKIKTIALIFIGLCVLVGTVVSKVSLVSITGRMFELTSYPDGHTLPRSALLFVQLTFLLVVPELVSFIRCLVWGVIGKTTENFPWPSKRGFILVVVTSIFEVFTLCGFVFGVACKLPPSLTILIMNGCFCYPIGRYLIHQVIEYGDSSKKENRNHHKAKNGYFSLSNENITDTAMDMEAEQQSPSDGQQSTDSEAEEQLPKQHPKYKYLLTSLELFGFLIQLGTLVSIPILLSKEHFFSPSGKTKHNIIATYILIPVSLCIISVVWSGWIQNMIISMKTSDGEKARFKTGLIGSVIRIILIPLVSYLYAAILLNLNIKDLRSDSFNWNNLELITFLTHVIVSFLTYFFAWIACALKSWAFIIPMFLSTPISFIWYVISVEAKEIFPFTDEYFVEWNLNYIVLIVAGLLWISQFLAFGFHITFQKSDSVLTNDASLFWMPRYNSIFLEQQLVLNRKTDITGSVVQTNKSVNGKILSKDNVIFICSTMYHETEEEMKQLLESIRNLAKAESQTKRNLIFESHIFFDDACTGEELNLWTFQLLGLLKDTLGIEQINKPKIITPYGIQLVYTIKEGMSFYIHLKDNNKVKNKKRWSQVMYMNYVLKYRIKQCEMTSIKNAFILTTDADVDFTNGSVIALLDILARDDKVGAVCARTHPLGSGPVVWYQKFDYALGHWFQKAAEHILGCVLCCPGCFSVFRVSALEDVIGTYSSKVENGFDFLTKDMGEDRWLCTLLIQKRWRLEYSAVSQDSTYCPDSFEEFYKQRRRWIPSTIANLVEVISGFTEITKNDSITVLFIIYEFLILFSSLISPATVILFIVTGIKGIDHSVNEIALIIVLCIISVLFGVICIYATEKTQLDIAKLLTLVFSIVMAVVISGIVSDTINNGTERDEIEHANHTSHNFQFPVGISAVYIGLFAVAYIMAGVLHFNEIFCLFHFIWYLLCLPSGYLFLIIYSVCNINNRNWGTREGTKPKGSSQLPESWLKYFLEKWFHFRDFLITCIWKTDNSQSYSADSLEDSKATDDDAEPQSEEVQKWLQKHKNVQKWLKEHNCEMYAGNFKKGGYTELYFIATMKRKDFEDIGIKKRGFLLKLEKEVKKLHSIKFKTKVSKDVPGWLKSLKLEKYTKNFKLGGYYSGDDVENLKGIEEKDLIEMGITKRAHLNQIMTGLRYLKYPTSIDKRINDTRSIMKKAHTLKLEDMQSLQHRNEKHENDTGANECKFWDKLAKKSLQPESANLGETEILQKKLKSLRNYSVVILFLINVMWIVFLYTLVFPQLTKYNLPDKAFSLLFLFIFSIILLIQFLAMLFHRFETMLHLLAGIRPKDNNTSQWVGNDEDTEDVNRKDKSDVEDDEDNDEDTEDDEEVEESNDDE